MLVRQRAEQAALPEFRRRLAAAGVAIPDDDWLTLPERDVWLERYETFRLRSDPVVRHSRTHADFSREVETLCRLVDHDVMAIPRSQEVGCVRLPPDRLGELVLALLDADGDDVSMVSTGGEDCAHLTMYEESGAREHELQVWGSRWSKAFTE